MACGLGLTFQIKFLPIPFNQLDTTLTSQDQLAEIVTILVICIVVVIEFIVAIIVTIVSKGIATLILGFAVVVVIGVDSVKPVQVTFKLK